MPVIERPAAQNSVAVDVRRAAHHVMPSVPARTTAKIASGRVLTPAARTRVIVRSSRSRCLRLRRGGPPPPAPRGGGAPPPGNARPRAPAAPPPAGGDPGGAFARAPPGPPPGERPPAQ